MDRTGPRIPDPRVDRGELGLSGSLAGGRSSFGRWVKPCRPLAPAPSGWTAIRGDLCWLGVRPAPGGRACRGTPVRGSSGSGLTASRLLRREWAGAVAGGGGDMEPAAAAGRRAAWAASAGRLDPVKKLWTAHPFRHLRPVGVGCFVMFCPSLFAGSPELIHSLAMVGCQKCGVVHRFVMCGLRRAGVARACPPWL